MGGPHHASPPPSRKGEVPRIDRQPTPLPERKFCLHKPDPSHSHLCAFEKPPRELHTDPKPTSSRRRRGVVGNRSDVGVVRGEIYKKQRVHVVWVLAVAPGRPCGGYVLTKGGVEVQCLHKRVHKPLKRTVWLLCLSFGMTRSKGPEGPMILALDSPAPLRQAARKMICVRDGKFDLVSNSPARRDAVSFAEVWAV